MGHGLSVAEVLKCFGASVGGLTFVGLGAFDEGHLDGDLDFEDVDVVAIFAKLGHGAGDDGGLFLCVGEGFFVAALGVIADEFKEERDVVGEAFVADALDPGVLEIVDGGGLVWAVVEEDLDAVGTGFLEAADGPDVEEVGQTAGSGGVVAGFLIGKKKASGVAIFGSFEAKLGVKKDGGSVAGEHIGDKDLELAEIGGFDDASTLLGEGLLEGAALVHGGCGDDAPGV